MAIVPVYPPALKDAICVAFMSGTPHMVSDFIIAFFLNGFPQASRNIIQYFIPADAFPFPGSTFAFATQRIKDTIRIGNLVDGSGALSAIPPTATRVIRITLKLTDFVTFLIYVCRQTTGTFTFKSSGWYN
jgi:hypothetical protein